MKKLLSLLMLLMTAIPAINAADYKLVTSNDDLEAGAKYIIVSPEKKTAMGAQSAPSIASYRVEVSVDCVDNIISLSDEQTAVAVVELGGSEGSWTLKDLTATKGYIVATTSKGAVNVSETATANYEKCSINISSDAAAIEYSGVKYYRLLYNKSSTRFGCYAKSSTLDKPLLFKQLPKAAIDKVKFSLASGIYYAKQYVTLSIPEGANEVRYSTDISIDLMEDGSGYKVYTDGESITIDKSCTLRAIATDGTNFSSMTTETYTMKTLEPSIDVEKASGLVTITPDAAYEASNVKIYYTTNGDTPVVGSANEYTEPFTVAKETEVKAIAVFGEFDASDVASYNYSDISKVTFDASVSSDFGGLTGSANDISKKVFEKNGISLAFTLGTATSANFPKYYNVSGDEIDVRFYVGNVITISSNDYVINKVVFNTASGYNFSSVYDITSGTVSYNETEMTWNGINSNEASFKNNKQARITKIEVYYSEVGTASFDAPVISLESGTYNEVQKVKLTMPEGATSVRYTTDDAVDLENGTGYTEYVAESEITIDKSCTLRAVATDGTNFSPVATATYTMKTAAPVITAEGAVDGVFRTETLDVTISSQYDFENVIFECNVTKEDGTTEEIEVTSNPFTFQIAGTTSITLTALYGDFDISDVVETTFTYMDPNIAVYDFTDATKWGYDQPTSGGKTVIDGVTLKISDEYPTISNVAGGGTKTRFYGKTGAESVLRAYSKNTLTFTAPANLVIEKIVFDFYNNKTISSANTKWSVGEYDTKAYTWSGASQVVSVTLGETNVDINSLKIYVKDITAVDQAGLLSMSAGKYYQVNVNLQGVKSHNGVLYARTVDTTVNPSEPGKNYFDSYEDSDYAQFAQHDWVAIDGLGSDYESKNITAGFVAQYDGTKLLPVNAVVPGSDETVTTNTFGVANVFYGNYENTNGFGYKPFFVKAKLNEVATFVAKAVAANEIQGSGECGVINGKGLKVEGSDLTDNIGKYVALDGVLVADAEANGGVKVIVFGVGTPTGVDSAIAEGTVAIYGTEGAVSVTGVTGTVELYDATGRLAKVAEAEGSAVIAMPAGYYIVRASGVAKAVIVK